MECETNEISEQNIPPVETERSLPHRFTIQESPNATQDNDAENTEPTI